MTVVDEDQAVEHIHGVCLKTGPPWRVGVELEWLVRDVRDPALAVPPERITAAVAAFRAGTASTAAGTAATRTATTRTAPPGAPASSTRTSTAPAPSSSGPPRAGTPGWLPTSASPGRLPSGALLTTEPGGQLELSSLPADSLADCVRATAADLAALRAAAATAGLELAGIGLDPLRPPRRLLDLPRYAAMEEFFDRGGPWGRQMMCATASVQVCLDAGDDSDGPDGYRARWRLLHAIGPVLVAAFANSPLRGGRPTGWRSTRQQVWARMDPGRTRAPVAWPGNDPRAAWVQYALDAQVMCVREDGSADWSAPPGLTLRDWLRDPADCRRPQRRLRAPTADDLTYHLSTLFPPVRPRGHLELRMIDAQQGDGWIVPLAVACALLSDAAAADAALAAVAPLWDGPGRPGAGNAGPASPWLRAARLGPADPVLARASRDCFTAARAALDRMAAQARVTAAVDAFTDQYVTRNRCPADDLLEEAA